MLKNLLSALRINKQRQYVFPLPVGGAVTNYPTATFNYLGANDDIYIFFSLIKNPSWNCCHGLQISSSLHYIEM